MKDAFKRIITDFHEKKIDPVIPRDYRIPVDSQKIVSLIGVRRSGKTYILYDVIHQLTGKVNRQNIVYVNFEDDRLYQAGLSDLDSLVEGYYELFPGKRDERVYFFLDEIQNIDGWEKFIRRIYDSLNVSIFVTGSSSKLLSSEIATALRGRTITYEVFPLSFQEYLRFKNIEVNLNSSRSLSYIQNAWSAYVVNGGFPETVNVDGDLRKRILGDYVDLIVHKDLMDRYSIKNGALLKYLIKYTFINVSTMISFTKLYNDLKSQGFKLGKDTLFEYFSYLNDAYALFAVPIFRNSVKEEQRNPKKIYLIDNGFKSNFDAFALRDIGRMYENVVFLELRRKTRDVYYFKQNQEVDFYCQPDGKKTLINVSYDISSSDTRKREISGLAEAMDYFNVSGSILVNKDHDEIVKVGNKKIHILPAWKWLLKT